jgi:hypothetical protein
MEKINEQDTQPRPRYAKPNLPKGDFAAGERTVPASPVVGDFATGEHDLPASTTVGSFANGERTLPTSQAVEDFVSGVRAPVSAAEKVVAVRPVPPLSTDEPELSAVPFVPKGDFAQGERTLPVAPVIPDFARGERSLPATASLGDFASGEHELPASPVVGDFASGEHDLPAPPTSAPPAPDSQE